jgi:Flp pilus assembly protein TadG
MGRNRIRGTPRRAATTVEFAVVSVVFFLFILATFELGRGLMVDYQLRQSARQACRVGVPAGRTNADVQAEVHAALKRNGLPQTDGVIKVNGVVADVSSAASGDKITVDVILPLTQVTWVPFAHYLPTNLGGTYSLRRE